MERERDSFVWFLLILVGVVTVSCNRSTRAQADEMVINGKLTNSTKKTIWLNGFDGIKTHLIDSARIGEDASFSFRIKTKEAGFYIVSSRKNDNAVLIAQPGETITLTGDADHLLSSWNAKGSKETSLYLAYWNVARRQLKQIDSLTILFRMIHMNPEYLASRIRMDSVFNAIMEKQRTDATRFINKNPGSLASLLVIDAKFSKIPLFYEERDITYFKMIDSGLTKNYPGNKLTNDFHHRVQKILDKLKKNREFNRQIPPGELSPSYKPIR